MAFEPGDSVVMKAGVGPVMNVASVTGEDVRCVWMEMDGKRAEKREETFPVVVLKPYTPPTPQGGAARSRVIGSYVSRGRGY